MILLANTMSGTRNTLVVIFFLTCRPNLFSIILFIFRTAVYHKLHTVIERTLNACKNILVVSQVMDRPLGKHVLRALNFECGNPDRCVPVPCALTGDCIFRSVKSNPHGGDKKIKNMGTDIGKRKRVSMWEEYRTRMETRRYHARQMCHFQRGLGNRQQHMVPVTCKITPTAERPAQIRDRTGRFDGN